MYKCLAKAVVVKGLPYEGIIGINFDKVLREN